MLCRCLQKDRQLRLRDIGDVQLELREAGIVSPILILTESPTSVMDEVVQYDLTQTLYSFAEARNLSDEAQKRKKIARAHVKIDTIVKSLPAKKQRVG